MKIKAALPKGDADGLSAVESVALKRQKPIVAIVILEPAKIDEDLHTKEKQLIVSIRRIEALLADDVEAATRLLQRSFESRTGQATLPIELEEDVKDALKGVDLYLPNTEAKPEAMVVPAGGYSKMKVPELRDLLKQRGLDYSQGTKTELIGRLEGDDAMPKKETDNVVELFADGSNYQPDASEIDDAEADAVAAEQAAWDAAAPAPAEGEYEHDDADAPVDDEEAEAANG